MRSAMRPSPRAGSSTAAVSATSPSVSFSPSQTMRLPVVVLRAIASARPNKPGSTPPSPFSQPPAPSGCSQSMIFLPSRSRFLSNTFRATTVPSCRYECSRSMSSGRSVDGMADDADRGFRTGEGRSVGAMLPRRARNASAAGRSSRSCSRTNATTSPFAPQLRQQYTPPSFSSFASKLGFVSSWNTQRKRCSCPTRRGVCPVNSAITADNGLAAFSVAMS